MAIYHLSTKMVKRSDGRNAVAAAAYRSGTSMVEDATGLTHDYSKKMGVEHSEILAPDGAAEWVFDRQLLWNTVEAFEDRKDSQVAREIEIGLPIELSKAEQIELLREYVKREFVSRGMVADFSLHLDNPENPHAHILLTTRELTAEGFGRKNRDWNQTSELRAWRRGWAEVTNEHLAHAGLAVRIDHRSYRDQQLDLIPGRKLGVGRERQEDERLPSFLADRIAEQRQIMGANGEQILKDPGIALKALTHGQATFSHHDIARFLNTRTDGAEQFQAAYLKVTTSPELVGLGVDDQGRQRFTTREMFERERGMLNDAEQLARRGGHRVSGQHRSAVLSRSGLSDEQRQAFEHVTDAGDLKSLVGVAGSGKSTALSAMRQAWEAQGFSVKGAALSGIAAENLQVASGIQARTLASYELAWNGGRDPLTPNDVLVIDEAGMVGTRQLARVLEVAQQAHAKVVLVGDPEQLQAIEAGAPFRGIAAAHGVAELAQVRRQRQDWQRTATGQLASGQTRQALVAYQEKNAIVAVEQRQDARRALLARWARDAKVEPEGSQLVLAYTRDDVQALNLAVRTLRQQTGKLGRAQVIATEHGQKEFAVHDRIRFGRNEKALGVKNGSLGTVERIEGGVFTIKLDGSAAREVTVDTKFYKHLDHGYAATVHKAQGSTVDRTYVLATPHFDRHTAYVALSRHREAATVFYATDDFGGRGGRLSAEDIQGRFMDRLSRAQAKDLAHDYLHRPEGQREEVSPPTAEVPARKPRSLEDIQAAAREQWLQNRAQSKESGEALSLEEIRRQGRENWLKLRAERGQEQSPAPAAKVERSMDPSLEHTPDETPLKSTSSPPQEMDLEQIQRQGREANTRVQQQLERERLAAEERERTLEKERSRGRGRGRGPGRDVREAAAAPQSPELTAAKPERDQKPDRFKGLKLKSQRGIEADGPATIKRSVGRLAAPASRGSDLIRALDGFARAWCAAARMRDQDLPIIEHQRAELREATAALERVRPGATQDLLNAVKYEPDTVHVLKAPAGPERSDELLATLEREARVRTNPDLKAERLVKVWQSLEAEHQALKGYEHEGPRKQIEKELQSLTREIKSDAELGGRVLKLQLSLNISYRLERVLEERDLKRALNLSIDLGRGRGLSL